MKLTRILTIVLAVSLLVPTFALAQEEAEPDSSAVAVAVAKTATDGAVEAANTATAEAGNVAREATSQAREAVADAVNRITPNASAKDRIYDALIGFLEIGKDGLEQGMNAVGDGVTAAGEFAGTQIPLVLKELIMLRRAEVLVMFLLTLTIGFVGFYLGRRLWKWVGDPENTEIKGSEAETGFALVALALQIASVLFPVMILVSNLREWILPWFAPRIYLIEYTVKLIEQLQLM